MIDGTSTWSRLFPNDKRIRCCKQPTYMMLGTRYRNRVEFLPTMNLEISVGWPEVSAEEREKLFADVERFYKNELEPTLVEEYEGMLIVIDARSREYEIATDDNPFIHDRLLRRCPDAVPFTARIGRAHLYFLGNVN